MRQGFNVQFYCRACKSTKNGTAPLELAININGVRRFINLPFKVRPEDFHRKRQPKEVVDYITLMRTRINEILAEMLRRGEPLTTQALIEYVRSGGYKAYTLEDLFNEYLSIQRERVGAGIQQSVYRKFELTRDMFFSIADRTRECDLVFTHANVLKFKSLCEGKYEPATAAGYLKRLKQFSTFGMDSGRMSSNPFTGIRIRKGEKPIVYLSKEEQRLLIDTPIENESLARVRDFAVFQLSTGMGYADLKAFRREDVRCSNGTYYIEKPRVKTGRIFTAVVLKDGMDVLARYDGELPVISNCKYNLYLKTLQDLCGISTTLTTHLMRRTYATNLINAGVRLETVASACGHGVAICKRYYAELQKDTVISEIAKKLG